jgi:Arc/MetJ family transcription regulator
MTKRLIEIDDELLESARQELGTSGIADTVRSPVEFTRIRARRRALTRYSAGS